MQTKLQLLCAGLDQDGEHGKTNTKQSEEDINEYPQEPQTGGGSSLRSTIESTRVERKTSPFLWQI